MAKKFGRVEPVRIPPEIAQGSKDKKLVEAFNLALDQIVTQTNTVLQRATARMMELSLWTRGQIITIAGEEGGGVGTADIAVRHSLGVIPQYWIPLDREWAWGSTATAEAATILKSDTAWTDTHVFFKSGDTSAIKYTILLIP